MDAGAEALRALYEKARDLRQKGEHIQALELAQSAGVTAARFCNTNDALQLQLCRFMADLCNDLGRFAEADAYYAACEPPKYNLKSKFDAKARDEAAGARLSWCNSRAILAEKMGYYALANEYYSEAADLYLNSITEPSRKAALYSVLPNAALMKELLGDWEAADALLQDQYLPEDTTPNARYSNLMARATVRLLRYDLEAGRALYDEVRALITELGGDAEIFASLATVEAEALFLNDEREAAFRLLNETLKDYAARQPAPPAHHELNPLLQLGRLHLREGDIRLAAKGANAAWQLEAGRAQAENLWHIYNITAHHLAESKKPLTAIFSAKLACETLHQMATPFAHSQRQHRALWHEKREAFELLVRLLKTEGRFIEAQRTEKMLKIERVKTISPSLMRSGEQPIEMIYTADEAALRDMLLSLRSLKSAVTEEAFLEESHQLIGKISEGVLDQPRSIRPQFNERSEPSPILAKEGLSLRYEERGGQLFLRVEHPNGTFELEVAGSKQELADLAYELHRMLAHELAGYLPLCQHFYDLLLRPVEAQLNHAKELYIELPDFLALLPFAALHSGSGFLAESHAITHLSLMEPPAGRRAGTGALLCGAGLKSGDRAALDNVALEIEAIARTLPDATRLIENDFTVPAFEAGLGAAPAILHLACHFRLMPGNSPLSYFQAGDGAPLYLDVFERAAESLSGLDLVFLSACETGTRDHNLDGVGSLADFFLYHGADKVVASLWEVEDKATATLAARFYEALMGGANAALALREAQMAIANLKGGRGMRHPFFWAGFQIWQTRKRSINSG